MVNLNIVTSDDKDKLHSFTLNVKDYEDFSNCKPVYEFI